ncbi:MAG: hypothetical protein ACR2QM_10640 [Longimicrobiales bacterium]
MSQTEVGSLYAYGAFSRVASGIVTPLTVTSIMDAILPEGATAGDGPR